VIHEPEDASGYTSSYQVDDPLEGEAVAEQLQRCRASYEAVPPLADDAAFIDVVEDCARRAGIRLPELAERTDVTAVDEDDWALIEPCVAAA